MGEARPTVTIVSGLPRSGTSLTMQLLEAAGLPLLQDFERAPDLDNPRGYYELAAVTRIHRDAAFLERAVGHVVKIVAPLLTALPGRFRYRIFVVERDLDEVLASQRAMLARRGGPAEAESDAAMRRALAHALEAVEAWLAERPDGPVHRVRHQELIADPLAAAEAMLAFLARTGTQAPSGAAAKMADVVDEGLYRQRG